jgi:hypothetical protein
MDKELLESVRILLEKPVGQYYYEYIKIHKKLYNTDYHGCKCHSNVLYNLINNWYICNKDK